LKVGIGKVDRRAGLDGHGFAVCVGNADFGLAGIGQACRPISRIPIAADRADPIIELRVSCRGGDEKGEIDGTLKPTRPPEKQNVMTILQHLCCTFAAEEKRKILPGAVVVGKTPPLMEELLPIAVRQRCRVGGLMEVERGTVERKPEMLKRKKLKPIS